MEQALRREKPKKPGLLRDLDSIGGFCPGQRNQQRNHKTLQYQDVKQEEKEKENKNNDNRKKY
jgi:hypothetical protein